MKSREEWMNPNSDGFEAISKEQEESHWGGTDVQVCCKSGNSAYMASTLPGGMIVDPGASLASTGASIRTFETGATRDSEEGKIDLVGFLSSLSLLRYGQYMLKHQRQSDGTMRESDNWKKGIPIKEYIKSLDRHVLDVKLVLDGFSEEAREDIEESLCAALFNVQGLLHEVLLSRRANDR